MRRRQLIIGSCIIVLLGVSTWIYRWSLPPVPHAPRPRPLPIRLELIESMEDESLKESVLSLTDMQDFVISGAFVSEYASAFASCYAEPREHVPLMNRVRKICAQAENWEGDLEDDVLPLLRGIITESVKDYEADILQMERDMAEGRSSTYDSAAMLRHYQDESSSRAAVYLLGEFQDHRALPLLMDVYRREGRVPVPRLFLFAVMHELVHSHRMREVTEDAAAARLSYLKATKRLPRATRITVPTWDAPFSEADFRHLILRKDIGLDEQETVELTLYPQEFSDLEWQPHGIPKPEVETFIRPLEAFIRAAYGE